MSTNSETSSGASAITTGLTEDLNLPAEMFRSGKDVQKAFITQPRKNIGLQNHDARYTIVKDLDDEVALFEGDIVLGTRDEVLKALGEGRGLGIVGEHFRWPDGIIPFVAQDSVRPRAQAAIQHWMERTPFKFVPRVDQNDHISFEHRDGCWSRVGRQGGKQVISLGGGCGIGAAIHEIGHALGLWHEQSRSDRDDFIEVIMENVDPEFAHNFDKHLQDGKDLGPYDHASIMHYPATAFSINGLPTIRVKGGQAIGQTNGLSAGDVAAMKMMYNKLAWP
jgi:Astacin (Peptidase family M12A)